MYVFMIYIHDLYSSECKKKKKGSVWSTCTMDFKVKYDNVSDEMEDWTNKGTKPNCTVWSSLK